MRLREFAVGILLAGSLFVPVLAQDAAQPGARGERRGPGRGDAGGGMRQRGMTTDQQMERLNKELNLTQEQQDRIKKLITDQRDQMREQTRARMTENGPKMRELRTQMEDARTAGDKEKLKKLEGQMRELMGSDKIDASRKKLMTDIEAVLTGEQKPKFQKIKEDVFNPRPSLEEYPEALLRAVESLDLPKEKTQKFKEMVDAWRAKHRGSRSADQKTAKADAAEVYKKVMAELTPEQQTKVKEWRPAAPTMGWRDRGEGSGEGRGQRRGNRQGGETGGDKPKE